MTLKTEEKIRKFMFAKLIQITNGSVTIYITNNKLHKFQACQKFTRQAWLTGFYQPNH